MQTIKKRLSPQWSSQKWQIWGFSVVQKKSQKSLKNKNWNSTSSQVDLLITFIFFFQGLESVGKTTLLYRLKLGEPIKATPTIGECHIYSASGSLMKNMLKVIYNCYAYLILMYILYNMTVGNYIDISDANM